MKHTGGAISLLVLTLVAGCGGDREAPREGSAAQGDGGSGGGGGGGGAVASTPGARGSVPMQVAATIDGETTDWKGVGECATSTDASIYQVPATQWHATFESGGGAEPGRLNLTVWRPKSGADDMANLSLTVGEVDHRIATVQGGAMTGSGTAGVETEGPGGRLTVSGKDEHGHSVELSVQCERFDELVAEGG